MADVKHKTKAEAARERNREIYKPLTEEQVEDFGEKCERLGIGKLFRCVDFSVTVQGYVEHEGALHQLYDLVNQREVAPDMLEALKVARVLMGSRCPGIVESAIAKAEGRNG